MVDNTGMSYRNLLGDEYSTVTLEGTLPDPLRGVNLDDWVVKGARVSYRGKSRNKEEDRGLIRRMLTHGHWTPFEQPQVTIAFRAPMAVIVQKLRHRTFHWNGESSRFKKPLEQFHIPKVWRKQSMTNKQGSDGELDAEQGAIMSGLLTDFAALGVRYYNQAIDMGVAREQARFFLPTDANYRSYVFTADLRNFMNMIQLRCASDTQLETRQYASAMFWLVAPMAPLVKIEWMDVMTPDVRNNLEAWRTEHGEPTDAIEG